MEAYIKVMLFVFDLLLIDKFQPTLPIKLKVRTSGPLVTQDALMVNSSVCLFAGGCC